MKEWVVWADVGARLALGGLLILAPRLTISALGLPKSGDSFWPRLVAVLLVALAVSTAIDIRWPGKGGPALGGLVALNTGMGFALATALVVGQLDVPRRGRLLLWAAAIGSTVLGLVQLAWA